MVATPIYQGAEGSYVRSALALALASQARGLTIDFAFILNHPQIGRARNLLSHVFLNTDFTHLLFIDSDIGFDPDGIFSMIAAMQATPNCAILGAPVPRRAINWSNIARAAEQGLGRDNPADLARYSGDYTFTLADSHGSFRLDALVELEHLGTGVMMIRRDVLETLIVRHPELAFRPDADEQASYGLGEKIVALFQPMINAETQQHFGDDYAFCTRAKNAGFSIYLAPWLTTSHTGPATFAGSLSDLAKLASSSASTASRSNPN